MENIKTKFGTFKYASKRIPLDTNRFDEQLRQLVPKWSTDDRKSKTSGITKTVAIIGKSPKPLPSSSVTVPKKVSSAPVTGPKPFKKIETASFYENQEENETYLLISDESNDEDPLQLSGSIVE